MFSLIQSKDDDVKCFVLFHKRCFFRDFPTNLRTCQIENFENISYEHQFDIMSQIIKASGELSNLQETTSKKVSVEKSALEENCFECLKKIEPNILRIKMSTLGDVESKVNQDYSMHFGCFFESKTDSALQTFSCSFDHLKQEQHELIEK